MRLAAEPRGTRADAGRTLLAARLLVAASGAYTWLADSMQRAATTAGSYDSAGKAAADARADAAQFNGAARTWLGTAAGLRASSRIAGTIRARDPREQNELMLVARRLAKEGDSRTPEGQEAALAAALSLANDGGDDMLAERIANLAAQRCVVSLVRPEGWSANVQRWRDLALRAVAAEL